MYDNDDFKTPVSRALDKLANDICTWYDFAQASTGTAHHRTSFTHARAVASSVEHLIRVVVRDEIQAWDALNRKDDAAPEPPPEPRGYDNFFFSDETISRVLKHGLRTARNTIRDWEEKL